MALILNAPNGSLEITGNLSVRDGINVQAGLLYLNGGTLTDTQVMNFGGSFDANIGTFDNVGWSGVLDLGTGGVLQVQNGLTLTALDGVSPGTLNINGNNGSSIEFLDDETLDNAHVSVGSNSGLDSIISDGTLTFGPTLILESAGAQGFDLEGDTIINQGTVDVGVSGGNSVILTSTFENDGLLSATNGGTLDLSAGVFVNLGSLLIEDGSRLELNTSLFDDQSSGGTATINGVLNANANSISLGPNSALSDVTFGGTIANATITEGTGAVISYDLGTFDNVVYVGTLDLGTGGNLSVQNGLIVFDDDGASPGVININGGDGSALTVNDSETLDNVTINIGSDTGFDALLAGDTLTLGSGVTVNAVGSQGFDLGGNAIVNQGIINSAVASDSALIDAISFVNSGTVAVSNGSALTFGGAVSGAGAFSVSGRSSVEFAGSAAAGVTVALSGTNNRVLIDVASAFAGAITGFARTDIISLTGGSTLGPDISFDTNASIALAGGSANLLKLANGGDRIQVLGGGQSRISAGNGNAFVTTGTGNSTVTLFGSNNLVRGSGSETVTGTTSSSQVQLGAGADTVNLIGASNNVTTGGGIDRVTLTGNGVTANTGAGNDIVVVTGNNASIIASAGNDVITLAGSSATVSAGTGNDAITLTGNSSSADLGGGNDTARVNGNGNTVTLGNGTSQVTVEGGTGNIVFLGHSTATVTDFANSGTQVYAGPTALNSVITNVGSDPSFVLHLTGGVGGYTTPAQAYAALTSDGVSGSKLALAGNHFIDFAGTPVGSLSASNFAIG